jgi:hypothetical protein
MQIQEGAVLAPIGVEVDPSVEGGGGVAPRVEILLRIRLPTVETEFQPATAG